MAKTETTDKPLDANGATLVVREPGDLKGGKVTRTFTVDKRAIDEDARTVELAFSSEEPVERWWGVEILDHGKTSVRLGRLNGGGALLVDHNHSDHVGAVNTARIDSDRKGRAMVRFGRSTRAQEIFQDVVDGIRSLVSVGYIIHDAVLEERREDGDVYRVIDWEPYEISFVAVPADATVGVGRKADFSPEGANHEESITMSETRNAPGQAHDDAVQEEVRGEELDTELNELEAQQQREERNTLDAQIRALGTRFKADDLANSIIELEGSVEDMKRALRSRIINRKPEPVQSARDVEFGKNYARTRALRAFKDEETAYRSGMWARAHLFGDQRAARWCKDHGMRVMVESSNTKGGAIVPVEMEQSIIDLREQYGVARQLCRVIPMASDTMDLPRRIGGVTAYFVGEEDSGTESDKSWDNVQLNARKLMALTRMSSEYAEDAVIDVAEDLANEMAYAFAEKEDDCLFNGDGTSTYGGIQGIRSKLLGKAGAVNVATVGHDLFSEIDADDLNGLMAKLPVYAQMNARWIVSQPGKALVFDALAQAAGGNTIQTMGGRPQPAYLGYPITVSQKMPTSTSSLDAVVMLLFGDISKAATLGDRRGFRLQVLTERYAEYDQIGIKATERFDINVHDVGDASNAGPVVGLIGDAS